MERPIFNDRIHWATWLINTPSQATAAAHCDDRLFLRECLADPKFRIFLAINGANLEVLERLSEANAINVFNAEEE